MIFRILEDQFAQKSKEAKAADLRFMQLALALGRRGLGRTWPNPAVGCVLVFVPSLGAYLAPDLLGGARTVYVGNLIQSQFAVARDVPFGSALSFLLSFMVLLLLYLFRRPLRASQQV